jgi:ABC-type molybdate transport system permease subunit
MGFDAHFYEKCKERITDYMNFSITANNSYMLIMMIRDLQGNKNDILNISPGFYHMVSRNSMQALFVDISKMFDNDPKNMSIVWLLNSIKSHLDLLDNRAVNVSEYQHFNDNAYVIKLLQDLGWVGATFSFWKNVWWSRALVIIINVWIGIPYLMLIATGVLMNVPADLYESSKIDGAGPVKQFTNITLPYLLFVTGPYLLTSFTGNLNNFNVIFLLTGGGPSIVAEGATYKAGQTDLLVTWLYKLTIENGDYNTGAIIGIFTFLITATITLITYRRSKAYNEEDTFQ